MSRWPILCVCIMLMAGRARAEAWSTVFAAEHDTAVFLRTDGTLIRAPFNLESCEVLWRPTANQHLVRFALSPKGGAVAWIVREAGGTAAKLWMATAHGIEPWLRYGSLAPRSAGMAHFEPDTPTLSDRNAHGVRLAQAGALGLRPVANTLDWAADGRSVLLGRQDGIVIIYADARTMTKIDSVRALKLESLPPSNVCLVDAVRFKRVEWSIPGSGRHFEDLLPPSTQWAPKPIPKNREPDRRSFSQELEHDELLLSLTSTGWRECPGKEWARARVRAAGSRTLWWAKHNIVYSVRAESCTVTPDLELADDVRWLGFDQAHGELLGASGRRLWRRAEAVDNVAAVLDASSAIRAVLQSLTSASVCAVTKDSLLVWNPETGETRRYGAGGLEACELVEAPDGQLVAMVECGPGLPHGLARVDPVRGCLVAVECPEERWGVFASVARGAWILLYDPGYSPPRTLHAYDVRLDRWHEVENPGLSAWEPIR